MESQIKDLQNQVESLKAFTMNSESSSNIARVSVKIPPFWPSDPTLWFLHIEAQFNIANIVRPETKYNHLIASLDSSLMNIIADVIKDPQQQNYDAIKAAIIKRCAVPDEEKLRRLLHHIEMGDKKPSQLLRELKSLAGPSVSPEVIKVLWMQRLPTATQAILHISSENIETLADMADKITQVQTPTAINHVGSTNPDINAVTAKNHDLDEIYKKLTALTIKVDNLQRRRARSKSNENFRRSSRSPTPRGYCWYHDKFGGKAKKCITPCYYNNKNQEN